MVKRKSSIINIFLNRDGGWAQETCKVYRQFREDGISIIKERRNTFQWEKELYIRSAK